MTRTEALATAGLVAGGAAAVLVVALFNRVVIPAVEIKRYARDVAEAGGRIASNLDIGDELARTRQLAAALPTLVAGVSEEAS